MTTAPNTATWVARQPSWRATQARSDKDSPHAMTNLEHMIAGRPLPKTLAIVVAVTAGGLTLGAIGTVAGYATSTLIIRTVQGRHGR